MPKLHLKNFLVPPTTELSPFLLAENQLSIVNGVNLTHKKGVIYKALGYNQVGDTIEASKTITGLHHFRQSPTVNKVLATANNSTGANLQLKYNNAGTWTNINISTSWDAYEDCLVEMEDFIGYCFFVGYDSTDNVFLPVGSLTGTTFSTSTNVTSMPQAKYIKRYRDRLYIANCYYSAAAYPYRVYFSSVPSAGAITWTPASDFLDVDYSEQITGLGENWDRMMIFTEYSAYMYDQSSFKKVWDTGCANHRTIKNSGAYMIWADKDNVWASTGGRPEAIGNDILYLIKNSTPSNWRAEVIDREYHLYLGDTSDKNFDYTNCKAVLNLQTGMWRWKELTDNVKAMARYNDGNDDFLYMGMADGEVMIESKYIDSTIYYADDDNTISAHFRTKAFDFGDPSIIKRIQKITCYSEYGNGLMVRARVYNKNNEAVMPFQDIGIINSVVQEFKNINLAGNFIEFEFKEISKNQAFRFYGMTIEYEADGE